MRTARTEGAHVGAIIAEPMLAAPLDQAAAGRQGIEAEQGAQSVPLRFLSHRPNVNFEDYSANGVKLVMSGAPGA